MIAILENIVKIRIIWNILFGLTEKKRLVPEQMLQFCIEYIFTFVCVFLNSAKHHGVFIYQIKWN